jgi:hypothetical protein
VVVDNVVVVLDRQNFVVLSTDKFRQELGEGVKERELPAAIGPRFRSIAFLRSPEWLYIPMMYTLML